jgi:hypothetical protein
MIGTIALPRTTPQTYGLWLPLAPTVAALVLTAFAITVGIACSRRSAGGTFDWMG